MRVYKSKLHAKVCLIFLLIVFVCQLGFPAFRNLNWNTRARGLGGAYTAVSDDAGALIYNVAGLGNIDWIESNLMYSKLYTGLEQVDMDTSYAGFVYPLSYGDYGTLGVDWARYCAKDLYSEDLVQIAYGYKLTDMLSVGIGVDYLYHKYVLDKYSKVDPVFANGVDKGNFGVNFGSLYMLNDYITLGFSGRNINRPDVGLKTKDIVPPEYRFGIAGMYGLFLVPVDIYYRDQEWGQKEDKIGYAIGTEYWLGEALSIRAGYNKTEITGGFTFMQIDLIPDWDIGISYALAWPLEIEETTGSHQLSITVRYGKNIVWFDNEAEEFE